VDVAGEVLEKLADACLVEALPAVAYRLEEPLTLLAQEMLSRHDEPADILRLFAALRIAVAQARSSELVPASSNAPW
jgi:hypothetical protein